MKRQKIRQAKALAAANRHAYFGLALGAAGGVALFAIALSVVPIGYPARMVSAQVVHGKPVRLEAKTNGTAVTASIAGSATPALPSTNPGSATPESAALPIAGPAYLTISFQKLSAFPFVVTDQLLDGTKDSGRGPLDTLGQIPAGVRALSDKEVALQGFMLPMKLDHGLTTEFLILKNQGMCCYGIPPRITEWVNARTAGKGIKPIMDQPVTVCGTFHVGEVRENGDLVGIYRLDCERVIYP